MLAPWEEKHGKPRQHIKKLRHHFSNNSLYSQIYGFSSSHVEIWELDHKEGWVPRKENQCFWLVVLEKTTRKSNQSILKENDLEQNIHWKDWCWGWSSNTLPIRCEEVTHWKRPWCWKREGKRRRGWQRMRWWESITNFMDMNLRKSMEIVKDREAWHAAVHGLTKSWTWLSGWTTATITLFINNDITDYRWISQLFHDIFWFSSQHLKISFFFPIYYIG